MRMARSIGYVAALAAALLVVGCATRPSPAPVVDRGTGSASRPGSQAAVPGATHVVQRGETLYSIALEHGVDYRELASWNGLGDGTHIRVGQALRLSPPGTTQGSATPPKGVEVGSAPLAGGGVEARPLDQGALAAQGQGDGSTKTLPKALRLPYSKENVAMLSARSGPPSGAPATPAGTPSAVTPTPTPTPMASAPESSTAAPGALGFIWPAKGKLLNGFSEPNNKGVDIAGSPGDPVVAAAPGRVMYTGTGIRGYGKLIVIKHEDGFNSVYAHNRTILVKEGQSVARGQRIAEIGATDSDRPKLHFEIRKSGKPVDPMKYLPPPS